jgi:hypothetical protein
VEKWPKYTFLRPFIEYIKSKIINISLFPDTSYKKRIHVFPNKGPNIVFENVRLNEGKDGDELDSGLAMQAYGNLYIGGVLKFKCKSPVPKD